MAPLKPLRLASKTVRKSKPNKKGFVRYGSQPHQRLPTKADAAAMNKFKKK